ncbi:YopT-type cysteine protease domain-containing protein [Erwinia phyllosphaerae]|uniref:YopT-type cysteine protease domain-containing protein n=1 Tax=Erwinia phyllosphaerae TaxID=2853256 RepID=UPI002485F543|nr:YopT-type cysteine protease domain-containing protein [Erwinia phyllosphaerae]MBV4367242.1 hypothetical protein [Erwinia phyllosphaerae]
MITLFSLEHEQAKKNFVARELTNGVCLTAIIDFCYYEVRNCPQTYSYYNDVFKFGARHRAYSMHYAAYLSYAETYQMMNDGKVDMNYFLKPVIRQTDGIGYEYIIKKDYVSQLAELCPGTYIIIIQLENAGHALALTLRNGSWVFFDPNFGSFLCDKGIFEFVDYLESIYPIVDFFALKIIKKNRFPLEKTVFSRYGQRISSDPALQGMTSVQRPEADVPVPARRRSIAPAPASRHGAPVPAPRRSTAPVPAPRHGAPVPVPRRSIAPLPAPRHGAPALAPRSSAVPVPALRKTFQGR